MPRVVLLVFALLGLWAQPAAAWDEVSHGHVTNLAIDRVHTPALRAFLKAHHDEVVTGSWFPDWTYQAYLGQRDHGHGAYLDAVWADLQDPTVRREKDYDRYLAHFMGAYAHVVEDRVLDNLAGGYAADVGDVGRDDMELAMVDIATYGYVKRDFRTSVPWDDLRRVYAKNAYFDATGLNGTNFDRTLRGALQKQDIENRLLKFLSFLTADWSRRQWPFAATHMQTAPGGFDDNARAVAAVWEAMWQRVHGKPAPLFVYSVPAENGNLSSLNNHSSLGNIVVVASQRLDSASLTAKDVVVRGEKSGIIPIRITTDNGKARARDVVFVVAAQRPWQAGERYHLTVNYHDGEGRSASYRRDFQAPQHAMGFSRPVSQPPAIHFGLWGAAALIGLGGVLFGLPGFVCLIVAHWRRREPAGWGGAWLFRVPGVLLVVTGIWFMATDGEWLITYLRHHH
jgi:hypothetical protein